MALTGLLWFYGFFVCYKFFIFLVAKQKMGRLADVKPNPDTTLPKVSIVVPIRNEAHTLKPALRTLFALDYPDLEWIVINDRSEDQTAQALEELMPEAPKGRFKVTTIQNLPPGWLGKNHALDQGARSASGSLILFCDADIHLVPHCLQLAVSHMEQKNFDHLSLLIRLWSRSLIVDAFIPYFGQNFLLFFRPWEAKNPKRPNRFIGIGAFNLVRKSALQKVDYFSKIPLRPDDDVKLGKIIKRAGLRQDCLAAPHHGSAEWYPHLRECIQGLEKNLFPGSDFRLSLICLGVFGSLFPVIAPACLLTLGTPGIQGMAGFLLATDFVIAWVCVGLMGGKKSRTFLTPVVSILYAYLLLRNSLKNILDGGITWRNTFYSLDELKRNVV